MIEDRDLLKRIVAGDRQAFHRLIEQYGNLVFQAVFAVLRHPKDAEDISQEAFLQIHASLSQYRGQGLKAWITRIAVNKAIDFKRRRARQREELTDAIDQMPIRSGGSSGVETQLLLRERLARIRERIKELPPNYGEVVIAFYLEEKSCRRIALEQGIELKSVESRLYRARQWMRSRWKEEFDDPL